MCQLFFDRFRDFFYQMEKCREWDGTLWRWGRNYTHKTYITVSRCIHAMSSISEFSILAIIPILDTLSLKFTQWKGMHATSSMQIHPLILNSNASYPTTLSRWILRSSMPIHPRVLSISCVQGQLVGDISFSNKKGSPASPLDDSGELDHNDKDDNDNDNKDRGDCEITWPSVFMLEKSVLFKLK